MQELCDLISLHISLSCLHLYDHRHCYFLSWSFNKHNLDNILIGVGCRKRWDVQGPWVGEVQELFIAALRKIPVPTLMLFHHMIKMKPSRWGLK